MNINALREIVEIAKSLPEVTLVPRDLIFMFVDNHPELKEQLVYSYKEEFTVHPTVAALLRGERTGTQTKISLRINTDKLANYLDVKSEVVDFAFGFYRWEKDGFITTICGIIDGEIDIRKCQHDDVLYVTTPDDEACVCESCKEYLLGLLGQ